VLGNRPASPSVTRKAQKKSARRDQPNQNSAEVRISWLRRRLVSFLYSRYPFSPTETRTDTRHQAQDTRRMSSATLARARDMSPSGAETTCHARLEDQPAVHVDGRPTKWECDDHEATKRRGVLVRDVRTSPAHARATATRGGDAMTSRQAQVASLSAHLQVRPRNARAFSSCSANAWRHGPKRASLYISRPVMTQESRSYVGFSFRVDV